VIELYFKFLASAVEFSVQKEKNMSFLDFEK
jgi:hypothetical protein